MTVQKRHQTRLFPGERAADDTSIGLKSGNIRPGVVVDRDICHPNEFDFYMNSHAGKGSVCVCVCVCVCVGVWVWACARVRSRASLFVCTSPSAVALLGSHNPLSMPSQMFGLLLRLPAVPLPAACLCLCKATDSKCSD